ncbi:MAG TPA: aminopeptidase P family N-terminal domain-containing protein, partial [Candidatus Deferrimicrobiaceae bacterium]|nr:aminopeptidase P family N-terminal domain-containing protein [Candidatus Deferrimicrobiaceae bacterium]
MPAGDLRIRRLVSLLHRRGIDLFLCVRLTNIRYLCGFSGSDAVLLVSPGGATLLTDGRYAIQSQREVTGAEVVITDRKWQETARRIRRARPGRIG